MYAEALNDALHVAADADSQANGSWPNSPSLPLALYPALLVDHRHCVVSEPHGRDGAVLYCVGSAVDTVVSEKDDGAGAGADSDGGHTAVGLEHIVAFEQHVGGAVAVADGGIAVPTTVGAQAKEKEVSGMSCLRLASA